MEELRLQEKQTKKQNPFDPKGLRGTIYMLLHDMVCILAVITVLFVFAARLVGVYGSSMYPTLVGAQESDGTLGDYLVLRSNFLSGQYKQGDIVVACVPSFENGKPIVKRVVAVGGQIVSFQADISGNIHVYVDGDLAPEAQIIEPMEARGMGKDGVTLHVPEGCYFLMGDNRNNSTDSRYTDVGMVDGRYILGKALWLVFPGQDSRKSNAQDWSRFGDIYD